MVPQCSHHMTPTAMALIGLLVLVGCVMTISFVKQETTEISNCTTVRHDVAGMLNWQLRATKFRQIKDLSEYRDSNFNLKYYTWGVQHQPPTQSYKNSATNTANYQKSRVLALTPGAGNN